MKSCLSLCQLARKTIESSFDGKWFKNYINFNPDEKTKEKFSEKKACFVTLTNSGRLRGCIGNIFARQELWKDVQENAIHAAFHDPRFPPLKKEDLKKVKIKVSVLTNPEKLEYKNESELLNKIKKNMGVILRHMGHEATFLPQVWGHFSPDNSLSKQDKIRFLQELSIKAGLDKDAWKTADIYTYNVEAEKE